MYDSLSTGFMFVSGLIPLVLCGTSQVLTKALTHLTAGGSNLADLSLKVTGHMDRTELKTAA